MTLELPRPDERIQVIRCIGCEQVAFPGQCDFDDHQRLRCPHCDTVVLPESIYDYMLEEVTSHDS